MTALQEKEIKNEMLDCLEQMDGQDILLLLTDKYIPQIAF